MTRLVDLWTTVRSRRSVQVTGTESDDTRPTARTRGPQNRSAAGSLVACAIVSPSAVEGRDVSDEGGAEVAEDVDDLEWTLETGLAPADIRRAGAAALAGGPHDGAVRENLANAGAVSYAVVDPESLATRLTMVVSWHELGAGRRRVVLSVRGHVVQRTRLLGVLPVGRATVPGLAPARRFSRELRDRLGRATT
jgi:hypothetical protein